MNPTVVFYLAVVVASVPTMDAAAVNATIVSNPNHKLAFPLQSVGFMSKHILLVDSENYLFTLDHSKLSVGERIFLNSRTPRMSIESFEFYKVIFLNNSFSSSETFQRVLGTIIFDKASQSASAINSLTNESIIVQVSGIIPNVKVKVVYFNTTNLHGGATIFDSDKLKNTIKANSIWISSGKENTFYLMDFSSEADANVTTLTEFKVELNKGELAIAPNGTYNICAGNSNNSSNSPLIYFAISPVNSTCKHSQSFFSALQDSQYLTGFTDESYFYLFGRKTAHIFKRELTNETLIELRQKPLSDFFTNGSVSITSGRVAFGTFVAMLASFLLLTTGGVNGSI